MTTRLEDFVTFAKWHVESGDVDPAYPVLKNLIKDVCANDEEALRFVLLYVAYYNLGSAVAAWLDGYRFDRELTETELRYATGTERRAHRDIRQFVQHVESLRAQERRYGSFSSWLRPQMDDEAARWEIVQQRLVSVHGNGRWAGYKLGEILDTVLDWRCPPPDAGHAHSSGPRHGLADLYPDTSLLTGNDRTTVRHLDALTNELCEMTSLPVAQVETVLCDFHSLANANYYVGHDIDMMFDQINRISRPDVSALIWEARSKSFGHRWLGEHNGWAGVRKPLKKLYRDTGTIEWWTE